MKTWKNVIIAGKHWGVRYTIHSGLCLKFFVMKALKCFKEILLGPPRCPRMELLSTALGPS